MAQDYITINNVRIKQPDTGLKYSFETTYSEDSTRTQDGVGHFTALFTVESFGYEASLVSLDEMKTILQLVASGRYFTMHYFSPYFGIWRDDLFYVGKGSLQIGALTEDGEYYDKVSFNMIGVNPVD